MSKLILAIGLAAVATPAAAQDIPSPYESAVGDYGQLQLQSTLAKRRLQQAQAHRRDGGKVPVSARSRAICRDKQNVAARLSPAKARQLHALCAQADY